CSEHVERRVLERSERVLRLDLGKSTADKAHFQKESEELKRWIRKYSVTTPRELDLLNPIEVALEAYLTRTTHLLEDRAQAGSTPSPKEVLEKVENKGQILDLCM